MLKLGFGIGMLSIGLLSVQLGLTIPVFDDDGTKVAQHHQHKRVLTPAETELANAARAHIGKVLEKNLIRLFSVDDERGSRQFPLQQQEGGAEEEGEEEAAETATFNPNTLPQVATLLGAIFSGNLNLTNVVDRAFYLVPDAVRKQVTGLFKLIGGNGIAEPGKGSTASPVKIPAYIPHPLDTTTTTPRPPPPPLVTNVTEAGIIEADFGEELVTTTAKVIDPDSAFGSVFEVKGSLPAVSTNGGKKAIVESDPFVPIAEKVSYDDDLLDDELKKVEEKVVDGEGKGNERRDKEPRFFLGSLQKMLRSDSVNFTEIFKAMPDLFKGARQAFVLLEQLGEIGDD